MVALTQVDSRPVPPLPPLPYHAAMLSHQVFFTMKQRSAERAENLIAAADKHLTGHPGCVFYGCGLRDPDYQRPVNDQDFDVALNIVFRTRADHDEYQIAERHLQFIDEQRDHWETVRVFDAEMDGEG